MCCILLGVDMATGTRNRAAQAAREDERLRLQRAWGLEDNQQHQLEVAPTIAVVSEEASNNQGNGETERPAEVSVVTQIPETPVAVGEVESREDSRSPEMNLSAREKAFIRELRSNQAVVEANALPPPPPPSADEEAYASILSPVTAFSRVHAHCLGIIGLSSVDLKKEVKKELRISEGWEVEDMEKVKVSLANALPKLGGVLLKKPALPVPSTFSAVRVVEVYRNILERFLMMTKVQKKKPSKRRFRDRSSSDDYSVSSDEGSSEAEASAKVVSKAVKWHIKSAEKSLRIGEESYSEEHLYECERLLVEYKRWSDPVDPGMQLKTVPHEVRGFVKKHLSTPGAPIMKAYDLPHVKNSPIEQKHVTFLLNKMGFLASKIAKARLSRAGKELDRFGRIRKGAALSKAERKESIAGEREWAGLIRWLSDMLGKGVEAYKVFQQFKNEDASLAHLLVGAPELSRSSVARAARAVAKCKVAEQDDYYHRGNNPRYQGGNKARKRKRRRGNQNKNRPGKETQDETNPKVKDRRCWHCNEKGHLTANCPSAIAGKPPHPKSRFGKSRAKNRTSTLVVEKGGGEEDS